VNKLETALVGASAAVASTLAAASTLAENNKEYQIGNVTYQAEMIRPNGVARGGVLLVPDWTGINEHARMQARHLAQQGHVVMIVDLYGKGVRPKDDAQAQAASDPMINDRALARERMQVALTALKAELPDAAEVASVGFSFGALAALELARGGAAIAGTVALWPVLYNPQPLNAKEIRGPVLILQGTQDRIAPMAAVQAFAEEMDAASRPYRVTLYGGVKHGFTIPNIPDTPSNPLASNPRAAANALGQVDSFLGEVLEHTVGK
jgi:dienelactone hydrolase